MNESNPEIFVLSGPNGAGKSTTAMVLLPETFTVSQYVNADLIAQGLSPFAPETTSFAAGRIMLQRIHELCRQRQNFGFETTLATRSYVPLLGEAQRLGYMVHVIYIALASVDLARDRVRVRVQQGGHDIPPEVVERRFWRGLRNFFELYQPLADTWMLCDNSGEELELIAKGVKGSETVVLDATHFKTVKARARHEP